MGLCRDYNTKWSFGSWRGNPTKCGWSGSGVLLLSICRIHLAGGKEGALFSLPFALYKSVRPFPAVGQFIIRLKTSLAIPPRVQFLRIVFICGHGVDSSFIHPLCWVCLGMTQDVWFLNKSVVLTFWFSVWWWQEYHVAYSLRLGLINFSEGLAVESTYEKVFGWSPLFSLFWD